MDNLIEKTIKTKEESVSWADIQFNAIIKIIDARRKGDLEQYRSTISVLEMVLQGFTDDNYKRDMHILDHQIEKIGQTRTPEEANIFYYDEKLKALSELIYRINKGVERVRQQYTGSDVSKEIAKNNIDGIGQNIALTGPPGSGKSWSAIAVAIEHVKQTKGKFDPKTHIIFTPQQFIRVYNDEKLTPEGSVIIFDEAGVTNNSKDNYEEATKIFNKLMQTIRHRAITIIFTVPDLGFITKDSRKLLHWWFETEKLNKKEGICIIKPFTVQLVQRDGKILFPYPQYDGKKVTKLEIGKLSDKVSKKYEVIAKEYKDDLALESQIGLSMIENSKVIVLKKYSKLRDQGKTIKEACEELNVHANTGTKLEKLRRTIVHSQ